MTRHSTSKQELKIVKILIISKIKEKMPKTMTLINCTPTRMTRIKKYVPKQKTMHVETVALLSKLSTEHHIDIKAD